MPLEARLLTVMSDSTHLTPRLIFQVELENRGDRVTILGITGEMSLLENGRTLGLAALNTLFTDIDAEAGRRFQRTLQLDLNHREIEIIEEARKGGNVQFLLNLKILIAKRRSDRAFDAFETEDVQVSMPRWGTSLMISQSEWVHMLQEMGYARLRIFELPIPEPPQGTIIDYSLRYVEEALKSFNEGDNDDVLSNCRNAIEEVEKANLDLPKLLSSDSKAEKVDAIIKRIKDYQNLSVHPGVKIDRKDAEAALYLTLSIVRYLAKRLQKT